MQDNKTLSSVILLGYVIEKPKIFHCRRNNERIAYFRLLTYQIIEKKLSMEILPETYAVIVTSNSLIRVVKSNIKVGCYIYVSGSLYTQNIDHSTLLDFVKVSLKEFRVMERKGALVSQSKVVTRLPEEAFSILLYEYFDARVKRLQDKNAL